MVELRPNRARNLSKNWIFTTGREVIEQANVYWWHFVCCCLTESVLFVEMWMSEVNQKRFYTLRPVKQRESSAVPYQRVNVRSLVKSKAGLAYHHVSSRSYLTVTGSQLHKDEKNSLKQCLLHSLILQQKIIPQASVLMRKYYGRKPQLSLHRNAHNLGF